jgi:hypothetical protein
LKPTPKLADGGFIFVGIRNRGDGVDVTEPPFFRVLFLASRIGEREMDGTVVLEIETVLFQAETGGRGSSVIRILQQLVDEVGLVGILV